MRIAGENGVAAITIILYAQFLFNSLYLGFSIGVAPVIGFQYGAKNRDQLKSLYKICNCFVIASSVVIAFFSWMALHPFLFKTAGKLMSWHLRGCVFLHCRFCSADLIFFRLRCLQPYPMEKRQPLFRLAERVYLLSCH